MGGCTGRRSIEEEFSSFYALYDCQNALGKGTFGKVFACKDKLTKEVLAVKVQSAKKCGVENIKTEIQIWFRVSKHKNVVRLFDVHQEANIYFMVMDCCQASLYERLIQNPKWTLQMLLDDLKDILSGLHHLHSYHVMHRDIKAENIMYGGHQGQVLKIADFGLACYVKQNESLSSVLGSVAYMAPEMLTKRAYDLRADMWSFGVLFFVIIVGRFPCGEATFDREEMKKAMLGEGEEPALLTTLMRKLTGAVEFERAKVKALTSSNVVTARTRAPEGSAEDSSTLQAVLPAPSAWPKSHRLQLLAKRLDIYSYMKNFLQLAPMNRHTAKQGLKSSLLLERHSEDDQSLLIVNHQNLMKKSTVQKNNEPLLAKNQASPGAKDDAKKKINESRVVAIIKDAKQAAMEKSISLEMKDLDQKKPRRKSQNASPRIEELSSRRTPDSSAGASAAQSSDSGKASDSSKALSSGGLSGFLSDGSMPPMHDIKASRALASSSQSGRSSIASVRSGQEVVGEVAHPAAVEDTPELLS
mmetsp:Transcript_36577/g.66324  ORF Transcript_36577/g.66324 Transcript_36577/m.66324 type:complete len:528 (-) Transcript_36577:44-1627(-)|eukprot:CAMPEP_0197628440 /NCGR_PEP_ID=MMETSP1338-20131121/6757_1 /TAXON_ID=43686 ORGANISM="Pelagodinium beii, Strain RCC1491" /NCGR_SAMPLE_ID=MMETSP1338 /ASSEMBLY_ACC=CAM_ASM_000754 /LENGTH=527 /DNA_ID=CAMNT_0043199421 /DNA_START=85 /DNA_END=1668 /DNA_ORIENTATION=-